MANSIHGDSNKESMNGIHSTGIQDESISSSSRFNSSEFSERARDAFDEASEMATEFYNRASHWLEGNYGKAVGAVAVLAAVGFLGFYLGKSSRVHMPELRDL